MSVLDKLASATPAERTIPVVLDAALRAQHQELVSQLADAARGDASASLGDIPATTRVIDQLEELRDAMKASEVSFTFRRVPWERRVALQTENQPRPGNAYDQTLGYNTTTWPLVLIRASCVRVVDAEGDATTDIPEATWDKLLGRPADPDDPDSVEIEGALNGAAISDLYAAAREVNDGRTAVPPSARSLLGTQDSGASLAQPGPGESAPDGSKDGNRPGSPKSSATPKDMPSLGEPSGT